MGQEISAVNLTYKRPLDFFLVCGKIASLWNPNRKVFDLVVSFLKSLTYILLAAFIWLGRWYAPRRGCFRWIALRYCTRSDAKRMPRQAHSLMFGARQCGLRPRR